MRIAALLPAQVLDFGPGSRTPKHRHGGPGMITVIHGQLTLNSDGVEKTYNVGESFTEPGGQTLQAFNRHSRCQDRCRSGAGRARGGGRGD